MAEDKTLFDYWRVIRKSGLGIVAIVMGVTLSALVVSLLLPKTYKAEAALLPIGGPKATGMAAAVAQMGLGSLLGGLAGGGSSTGTQLISILKSKTLAERAIQKNDLVNLLYHEPPAKPPAMEDMTRAFFSTVTFAEDKLAQILYVRAVHRDPKVAADLVNKYIEELTRYIGENTFTSAKKHRIFIEHQLERNKQELLEAGKEISSFYTTHRISNVEPRINVDVTMGTEEAPSRRAEDLQREVEKLDQHIARGKTVSEVPQQVYLQYLILKRETLQQINALLTSQYEMARIEENREDLNFQVLDWARVPIHKFKPKRGEIVTAAFVLSIFLGIVYAFFKDNLSSNRDRIRV